MVLTNKQLDRAFAIHGRNVKEYMIDTYSDWCDCGNKAKIIAIPSRWWSIRQWRLVNSFIKESGLMIKR